MKTINRQYMLFPLLLIILFAGSYSCQKKEPEQPPKAEVSVNLKSDAQISELLTTLDMHEFKEPVKAPEFELMSVEGKTVSLSQFRGNIVLLSYWATW